MNLSLQDMDLPLPLRIKTHSRAKRIILKVNPIEILLTLPKGVALEKGISFLKAKQNWILEQHQRWEAFRGKEEPEIPEMIHLQAIEEKWKIQYDPSIPSSKEKKDFKILEEEFTLLFSQEISSQFMWLNLRKWILEKGKAHLLPWLEGLSQKTGISYRKGFIKLQKTRWGSCSAKGNINLNGKLLFLPPYLAQYVMIHELCHQLYFNHSPKFWKAVESFEPAYPIWEEELDQYFKHIPPWVLQLERSS